MAQNLMVWLLERRVVLEERAEQLGKELADTEVEGARLEAAEIVYQHYQEDADAGHPDAEAWQQALEVATGAEPAVPAPGVGATPVRHQGAADQLLSGRRGPDSRLADLPELKAQHRRTLTLIDNAKGCGHQRVAEMNKQVADNLDRMITELEVPQEAADAG